MFSVVVFSVLLIQIASLTAKDFPSNFPRCYLDDPKLNDCLLNATIVLKPDIRKGIKELGIPSYDPLVIKHLAASQESRMVNFTVEFFNLTIRGIDNYDITNIQYDPKNMIFSGKFEFDPLSINVFYDFNGKLVTVPVRGNGTGVLALGPITGDFKIAGQTKKRRNIEFYDPVEVKINMKVDDASVHGDNLFDGDAELELRTNELLNQNSKIIVEAATPLFETMTEQFLMRYMKWLTKTYSYKTLFPQSK